MVSPSWASTTGDQNKAVVLPDVIALPRPIKERVAAEALGVSIDTLRRERHRGRIGYVVVAGRPRYLNATSPNTSTLRK